jgi:hypothetical protein
MSETQTQVKLCERCQGGNHSRHSDRLSGQCWPNCKCDWRPDHVAQEAELVDEAARLFLSPELAVAVRKAISDALYGARNDGQSMEVAFDRALGLLKPILVNVDGNAHLRGYRQALVEAADELPPKAAEWMLERAERAAELAGRTGL